ncbi:MAG: hypothetical protein R3C53_23290 [Pirellulaceae bacterium]
MLASTESLWVDELHSSWSISGTFGQIADRASAGNQTPIYLWSLWLVDATVGRILSSEASLRLLSWTAWMSTLWLVARSSGGSGPVGGIVAATQTTTRNMMQLGLWAASWLVFDRIQLFYASEARVYAIIQLLSVVGWLLVCRIIRSATPTSDSSPIAHSQLGKWLAAWSLLSILIVALHLTAAIAVAAQWLYLCGWIFSNRGHNRSRELTLCLASAAVVAIGCVPWVTQSHDIWERRSAWESFAGDTSWWNTLTLFPLLVFLIPIALGRLADRWLSAGRSTNGPIPSTYLWLIAACGPWLIAWIVTSLGIAPLFHRRFVIASAVPLAICAAQQLHQIQSNWLRRLVGICVLMSLLVSQGTVVIWCSGQWAGWQRAEGWRQATAWLDGRVASADTLWVASGLIEGRGVSIPISEPLDQYLSFPLRGCYQVRDLSGAPVRPHGLVNDWHQWPNQFQLVDSRNHWIVYRGPADALNKILAELPRESANPWIITQSPQAFGRVSVAAVGMTRPSSTP